jgi:hypothetical protein
MHPHVLSQAVCARQGLAAGLALVRPLSAMHPACASPDGRTSRRPCRTLNTRTAAPRCAPACAQPDCWTTRMPCRTSSARTAARLCAPACAQSNGLTTQRPPHVEHWCLLFPIFSSIVSAPSACFRFPPTRTPSPTAAEMIRTSGSPSRTSSAQSPSSNATPHTTPPLISPTSHRGTTGHAAHPLPHITPRRRSAQASVRCRGRCRRAPHHRRSAHANGAGRRVGSA